MVKKILATTDGSNYADRAIQEAIVLAKKENAELYVLSVVDQQIHEEPVLSTAELVTIEAEDKYHECLREVQDKAKDSGIDPVCEIRHGVPHELINEYADEIDADIIFIGIHGDKDTHLGGVGDRVIEQTEREVRVV